jgi:hypothetical protein
MMSVGLAKLLIKTRAELLFPVGEYRDAGQAFYATDFWSLWDLGTVAIGLAFFITSMFDFRARKYQTLLNRS